jgi:hypothetical protein
MVFFGEALAMHRVRMRRLRRKGQTGGPFVSEHVDVVPALRHCAENPKRGRQVFRLMGRIHQRDGEGFFATSQFPNAKESCGWLRGG